MAEFHNVTITQAGARLIALSQTLKKPLNFTKIMIGSGKPNSSDDISSYTELKNAELTADIVEISRVNNTSTWKVSGSYSNKDVSIGFDMQEVGLYAKVDAKSGDYNGEELLLGYTYADKGKADWLPAGSVAMETQEIAFYCAVENASSVTATIAEENFLRIADLTPQKLWDVRHSLGANYVPTDTTNAGWNALGLAISSYDTAGKIANQPSTSGQLINIPKSMTGTESMQMWLNHADGAIYTRRGNSADAVNDQTFKKLAFEDGAGVVAGDVSNADAWWVKLGGTIPLIIQGGAITNKTIDDNRYYDFTLPILMTPIMAQVSIGYNGRVNGVANAYIGTQTSTQVQVSCDASDAAIYGGNLYILVIGY